MTTTKNEQETTAVKHNTIIRLDGCKVKKWDKLTANQMKIVMLTASKVKPQDTPETRYTMTFQEFADLCKWSEASEGGKDYKRVWREVSRLSRCGVDFVNAKGKTVLFNWLNDVIIDPNGRGQVTYRIGENLMPFYKAGAGGFAIIRILDYMPLRGKYALLLYEYLSSWQNKGQVYMSVEQIRTQFEVPEGKYLQGKHLLGRVINGAVDEINDKCMSMGVRTEVKRGDRQAIEGVTFKITMHNLGEKQPDYSELLKLLAAHGIPYAQSEPLVKFYSGDRIRGNVEYADRNEKAGKVQNMPAYLLSAIQNDYAEVEQQNLFDQAKAADREKARAAAAESVRQLEERIAADADASGEPLDPKIAAMKKRMLKNS